MSCVSKRGGRSVGGSYSAHIGDVLGVVAGSDDTDDSRGVGGLDCAVESRGDATA